MLQMVEWCQMQQRCFYNQGEMRALLSLSRVD
jgi:hypothetical protein